MFLETDDAMAEQAGRVCPICGGSGLCERCFGEGSSVVLTGAYGEKHEADCRACNGTGECPLCHGQPWSGSVG